MPRIESLPIGRVLRSARAPSPVLTVAVVFMGAFLTTLQGRLFSISLADLRGQFGLDVIEGAWLSTAMNAAQFLTMPITVWLSLIFGPARVVIVPSLTIALAALAIPFVRDYERLLCLHAILGLCLGTYLPLTISLALRSLKPQYWLLAMAVYSLRASFGTDVGVGISGIYVDVVDWRWIYWTTSIAGPLIALMAWKGIPLTPVDYARLRSSDWGGMAIFSLSLAMLFAGCSLGETLGWFDSGVVTAFLTAGSLLLAISIAHIAFSKDAFVDFSALGNHNVRTALLIACLHAFLMAPTSTLIPGFLAAMGKLKPLQTGSASFIVFATYLAVTPLAVWLVRRLDARLLLIAGLGIIVFTSAWCGASINNEWRTDQYVPALILFATGECLTLMGIIPIIVVNMNPAHGVAIGFYAPLARIFAPGIAGGIITVALRFSTDVHSVMLKAGVEVGQPVVVSRTVASGVSGIVSIVARESAVLSYVDGFYLVFWMGIVALILSATLKQAPPNPLTPPRPG
ncbi:MFS transporter [Mesorhizobium sp. RMAD-H1]|uniref:MFS transporter n=1 Tax=Mesorhizobium sp. RMAD-H1 TaxID=2587065 RepID=UPI001615D617|nr:MFS transporter [Mesorhizobium sp. RMAD-H1]MBB2972756.1 DHA2 family multidrug resistance protein [Mesorhizobium sp. RMAD-H1]